MKGWPGVKGSPVSIDVIVNGWGARGRLRPPIPSSNRPGRCGLSCRSRRPATGLAQADVKLLYFGSPLLWRSMQSGFPVSRALPVPDRANRARLIFIPGPRTPGRDQFLIRTRFWGHFGRLHPMQMPQVQFGGSLAYEFPRTPRTLFAGHLLRRLCGCRQRPAAQGRGPVCC